MQLKLTNLVKRFHGQTALDGISLDAEARSLVLIGPSGGGKSTLLRVLAGLELLDQGSVIIDGDPLPSHEEHLISYRRRIGTVFQAYNLFPHLTALENVTLPLVQAQGQQRGEATEYALELLRRFHLEAHAHKMPMELSGGQQQRVAIVRAIAIKPRFLLLDEPTSALDPEMTAEVLDLIAELKGEGRELVLVTHNMGFARRVADHCLFLSGGRILETGNADELFDQPKTTELASFLSRVLKY
ncbi:amino acid ABC transporter ATP-binding protein [Geomonas silvestris]|uniref:Amino acid ABC transporter ATP-binding protein n=1 Tax=Geomonas silvestris TaxID=2740184 RepID=A0A6V8MFE6_9BACT|nr:amino acid ABC transporter ATP-binding protein [Geomonas silvestris]GFO58707.1 amino acid ABC transporter ATP-binding protein [Geomonas silvestris]